MLARLPSWAGLRNFIRADDCARRGRAERPDYKQVFLFDRLQTKLEDLNPKIPLEGLEEALRKVRLISHPTFNMGGSVTTSVVMIWGSEVSALNR